MDAPQRIALHELARARSATSGTSSSPTRESPPTNGGGAIGPPQRVPRGVVLVPPQRVVVAVGLGDVAEGVDAGPQVMRRHRVGLGDADPARAAASIPSSVMVPSATTRTSI